MAAPGQAGNPFELLAALIDPAKRLGAEILVTRSVAGVDLSRHEVQLDGGETIS